MCYPGLLTKLTAPCITYAATLANLSAPLWAIWTRSNKHLGSRSSKLLRLSVYRLSTDSAVPRANAPVEGLVEGACAEHRGLLKATWIFSDNVQVACGSVILPITRWARIQFGAPNGAGATAFPARSCANIRLHCFQSKQLLFCREPNSSA